MITFSIITCTYNAEPFLQRTLDSVRSQTYSCIQHVIVDGMSKDKTMDLVRDYVALGKHTVTVVSEKDNGLYDAMNKSFSLATGDYLVFLNAGDTFPSADTLSALAAQINPSANQSSSLSAQTSADADANSGKETLPGVLYGNTMIVNDSGESMGMRRLQPPEHLTWRSFKNGMLVCHQAFYVRTDIAQRTPYDLSYRLSADVDWCIRVMKESERQHLNLHNSHLVLCNYLAGGLSVQNHRASLLERFHIMRRHYGLFVTIIKHLSFFFR